MAILVSQIRGLYADVSSEPQDMSILRSEVPLERQHTKSMESEYVIDIDRVEPLLRVP